MPTIKWDDNTPEGKAREKLIKELLPKEPLTKTYLEPELNTSMKEVLIRTLKKEIDIYTKYPKKGEYDLITFEPRNPKKCFMGQGFQANGSGLEGWYDAELRQYRAAIGTIHHTEWGNVTLLEIWGGDHMKDHGEMVRGVMEYAHGKGKTCPAVDFFVNPFYKNEQTGQMVLDDQDKEKREEIAHLNKIADYCEIRNRLKKAKVKNPLALALKEEDDKAAVRNSRYAYDEEEDEDDQ